MPSRSPCPPYPPLNARIFGILLTASKGFLQKKQCAKKLYCFLFSPAKPVSPAPSPQSSLFCSKSRIYRQLDVRATQHQQSYNLRTFGIDFFYRPPYIVLAVVSENLSTLPLYLFFIDTLLFCSGRQIHCSQSLPASAIGISHLKFSRFVV